MATKTKLPTIPEWIFQKDCKVKPWKSGPSKYPTTGGHVADYAPAPCLEIIEIAIEEVKGLKLVRKDDKDMGLSVTFPVKE